VSTAILEDKVFVTLLYSLVAGAYLWSALVLFAVSAASDTRYVWQRFFPDERTAH
jgi:hypothetical protein